MDSHTGWSAVSRAIITGFLASGARALRAPSHLDLTKNLFSQRASATISR
jgi:hypothetical protein